MLFWYLDSSIILLFVQSFHFCWIVRAFGRLSSCNRQRVYLQNLTVVWSVQVEELFAVENNGTNVETRLVNHHLYKALKGSSFYVLNITHMSEYRADAHPSNAGGKKHDDCMHWCLPGITDTWNDLFAAYLNNVKDQSWYFLSLSIHCLVFFGET